MKPLNSFLLIVLSILISSTPGFAKTQNKKFNKVFRGLSSTSSTEKTVIDYFKCFEVVDKQIKSCVYDKVHSTVSKAEKDRFISWNIFFELELLRFVGCSNKALISAGAYPLATPDFICAEVNIAKEKKEVVFFFKQDAQQIKLFSVYY